MFIYFVLSVQERDIELAKEAQRQEENDKLRKEFAKHANAFHQWLTETRQVLNCSSYFFFKSLVIVNLFIRVIKKMKLRIQSSRHDMHMQAELIS